MRTDSGVEQGSEVGAHYDSMLAKVSPTAPTARRRSPGCARRSPSCACSARSTNAAYLRALLDRPEVRAGDLDTGLVERLGDAVAPPPPAPELPAHRRGRARRPTPERRPLGCPRRLAPWRSLTPLVMRLDGSDGSGRGRGRCRMDRGHWTVQVGRDGRAGHAAGDLVRDGRPPGAASTIHREARAEPPSGSSTTACPRAGSGTSTTPPTRRGRLARGADARGRPRRPDRDGSAVRRARCWSCWSR